MAAARWVPLREHPGTCQPFGVQGVRRQSPMSQSAEARGTHKLSALTWASSSPPVPILERTHFRAPAVAMAVSGTAAVHVRARFRATGVVGRLAPNLPSAGLGDQHARPETHPWQLLVRARQECAPRRGRVLRPLSGRVAGHLGPGRRGLLLSPRAAAPIECQTLSPWARQKRKRERALAPPCRPKRPA